MHEKERLARDEGFGHRGKQAYRGREERMCVLHVKWSKLEQTRSKPALFSLTRPS